MQQPYESNCDAPLPPGYNTCHGDDIAEHELVRLAKSGDALAFEKLVSRTREPALRMAVSILRSQEDALDEVQNALWLAYSRIELFTCESKFATWVIRIVINRCYMRLRILRRMPLVPMEWQASDGTNVIFEATTRETPEHDLARREIRQRVRRELNSIPPLLRAPLELHFMEGRSVGDIAAELGVSVAAVKSRLHRAQLYLRERMLKHVPKRGPASLTAA